LRISVKASSIAFAWTAAALFSGCAIAPSIYLAPRDAAYLASPQKSAYLVGLFCP